MKTESRFADRMTALATALAEWISAVALAVGLLSALMSVAGRYVSALAFGADWADETARGMIAWLTFTAAAILIRDDEHIKLEVLGRGLPPWAIWLRLTVADVLVTVGLGIVAWSAIAVVRSDSSRALASMPLPAATVSSSILVGTMLQIYFMVRRIVQRGLRGIS